MTKDLVRPLRGAGSVGNVRRRILGYMLDGAVSQVGHRGSMLSVGRCDMLLGVVRMHGGVGTLPSHAVSAAIRMRHRLLVSRVD